MPGKYEAALTIEEAINSIVSRHYLLPAIQRKFEWNHNQVCVLFDSIMRGYPINTFMFWEVRDPKIKNDFRFYQFLENYCERFHENNPYFSTNGHGTFQAIIDGQQRLTALYIGLKGTYAYKMPRKWWPSYWDRNILPPRKLYLELDRRLSPEKNDYMVQYNFQFLSADEYRKLENKNTWFEVGKILDFDVVESAGEIYEPVEGYLRDIGLDSLEARKALILLYDKMRLTPSIHYYKEVNQDMDHVLDIFIRTNSGGTPLAFSDLLMSIAVANWRDDARDQIDALVDTIRDTSNGGFYIDKDLVLKTCLALTDHDIRFKVKNFNKPVVDRIGDEWFEIKECLKETFKLIGSFGLTDASLRAKNSAIPIAYYLYHRKIGGAPLYKSVNRLAKHKQEREVIRRWLHMSLLKGVFGGQSDSLLSKLIRIIRENTESELFPLAKIIREYRGTNKDLLFDDDFVERLLSTQKEDASCFSILALLFPDMDFTRNLEKDHLHPAAFFTEEYLNSCDFLQEDKELREFYENRENWNSIANLCLLDSSLNKSKQALPLINWVEKQARNHDVNKQHLIILYDWNLEFSEFRDFILKRKALIKERLKAVVEASG